MSRAQRGVAHDPVYRLLALCARAEGDDARYQKLAQEARGIEDWERVLAQAETHRLAPLLYVHLKEAGVRLDQRTRRALQGLYLRHRRANEARTQTLIEILAAYQEASLRVLVLKGAALCHLLYPEPGLRPMDDIDLLVGREEARRAQALLADLGFQAPVPAADRIPAKHLKAATRLIDGAAVHVELHLTLFGEMTAVPTGLDDLAARATEFQLGTGGPTAWTLGREEMMYHLCQHLVTHADVFTPLRLIWIADIASFAERFVIDWEWVGEQYPVVPNLLSLIHFVTPLSPELLARGGVDVEHMVRGAGDEFQGWPRSSLAAQREKGVSRILRDTFFPSEWWLRLHYGLGGAQPLFWVRWLRHPLHILAWVRHRLFNH